MTLKPPAITQLCCRYLITRVKKTNLTEYPELYLVFGFEKINARAKLFPSSYAPRRHLQLSLGWKSKQKIKPPKRWNVPCETSQPESHFGGESPIL